MLNLKTPGVYIQEVSTLPASVAPVATAIPAFVGYTQKREVNGETLPDYEPVRITSLLEYEEIFGAPFDENYKVLLEEVGGELAISFDPGYTQSPYLLNYAMQMYFANGGGPCYVVSAGVYDLDNPGIDKDDLEAGIDALEQEDEPTILLVPETVQLANAADRKTLNEKLITQCDKLQDRFALFDVVHKANNTVKQDGDDFRNDDIGLSYLKYGAAYYPPLNSNFIRYYNDDTVNLTDQRPGATYDDEALSVLEKGSSSSPTAASTTITFNSRFRSVATESFNIGGSAYIFRDADGNGGDIDLGATAAETAENFVTFINANPNADPNLIVTATADGAAVTVTASAAGAAGNEITVIYSGSAGAKIGSGTLEGGADADQVPDLTLFNQIKAFLNENKVLIHPSCAMAGIYARVDRDRGVWKAPANVSVNEVVSPNILVTAAEQENLNVDATSGKSINAIRNFTGKGTLVWGSRTLAGNDNEWRYIPVRRLYIFIEESIKKATEPYVFEPNDANTWLKLKGLIENFLTSLWRDGALAGAVPADAFFVRIGLGQTMSAIDILEGKLNIEIGLAAVRPAEFIILKFSHKLQES